MPSRKLLSLSVAAILATFAGGQTNFAAANTDAVPARSSEQGWMISVTVNELSRLAAFASAPQKTVADAKVEGQAVKPDEAPVYHVTLPTLDGATIEETLTVKSTVWDPNLFLSLATKLVEHYKLAPISGFKDDALTSLTAFSAASLKKENLSLSAYLTDHPLDPAAHQTAAVLLGTLAMRENAGWMWDPSLACSRATAHLTLARALQPGAPIADEDALAELLIGLIIDTKAECTGRIADLKKRAAARPQLLAWANASALRNSRDYRLPPRNSEGTQFEKVEKFRALGEAASVELGIDYLRNANIDNDIELNRIALSMNFGVSAGRMFTEKLLPGELKEIADLLDLPYPTNPSQFHDLVAALDHLPGSVVTPGKDGHNTIQVIDRGMWCTASERHFCFAIYETWYLMQEMWGVPDDAAQFWKTMDKLFSGLRLYPIVSFAKESRRKEPIQYADRLQKLFVETPQDVPDYTWKRACEPVYRGLFSDIVERERAWFSPPVPTGSAYRAVARLGSLPTLLHPGLAYMEQLYKIAPLQEAVVQKYYDAKYPDQKNPQAFEELAGPLAEYASWTINRLAKLSEDNPAQHERALIRLATVDPDENAKLGAFYVQQHDEAKAVAAYQAMVDHALDRVLFANEAEWLVNYYYDHGDKAKAEKIAQEAAEVYSFDGLQTYARLLEKMGRLVEAEEYFKKIDERYSDSSPLFSFYVRHVADPVYAQKQKALELTKFPGGLTRVTLADFKDNPDKAAIISSEGAGLAPNGLKVGDLIVALDGYRVASAQAYFAIRSLKDTPEVPLIIYRDGQFLEIKAKAENRRFGCDIVDWPSHE